MVDFSIRDLKKIADERIASNRDCINFISGDRGSGKSTLNYRFSRRFPQFKAWKNIVYSRDDVKILMELKKTVVMDDEAIRTGYGRNFYEPDQKKLIAILNMNRFHNNVYTGCIPTFLDLDINLRNLCTMWIYIFKRGIGIVCMPLANPFSKDRWDVDNNLKLVTRYMSKQRKDPSYEIPWQRLSTFAGFIRFTDLSETSKAKYEKIRETKRKEVEDREIEEGKTISEKKKPLYERIMELVEKGLVTHEKLKQFAYVYNIEYHSLNHRLNAMLKKKYLNKTMTDFIGDSRNSAVFKKNKGETRTCAGFGDSLNNNQLDKEKPYWDNKT